MEASRFGLRRRSEMARRAIWVGFVVFCLAVGLKTPTSVGQAVFGSIIGTVTDPQGNAVAGAKVTVTSVTKSYGLRDYDQ